MVAGACVFALLAAFAGWLPAWAPGGLIIAAIVTNRALIAFFAARRGPLFAIGAFLFHQFQYLYSSAAFALALALHLFRAR